MWPFKKRICRYCLQEIRDEEWKQEWSAPEGNQLSHIACYDTAHGKVPTPVYTTVLHVTHETPVSPNRLLSAPGLRHLFYAADVVFVNGVLVKNKNG